MNSLQFDRNETNALKGTLAVCVLVHHLLQYLGVVHLFPGNRAVTLMLWETVRCLGIFSVAFFFFLSGYGLRCSFETRGRTYAVGLWQGKMLPFLGLVTVAIVLNLAQNCISGIPFTCREILQTYTFGVTVVKNGWFLQSILVLYVFVCAGLRLWV